MVKAKKEWWTLKVERDAAREMLDRYVKQGGATTANTLHAYADQLTKRFTAFAGIEDMINAQVRNYRPTFYVRNPAIKLLADLYDLIAERRNMPLRAHRVQL